MLFLSVTLWPLDRISSSTSAVHPVLFLKPSLHLLRQCFKTDHCFLRSFYCIVQNRPRLLPQRPLHHSQQATGPSATSVASYTTDDRSFRNVCCIIHNRRQILPQRLLYHSQQTTRSFGTSVASFTTGDRSFRNVCRIIHNRRQVLS